MPRADVVVIGAGLAGLSCAAELAEHGARVFLAGKGMATTHWTHGGIDVGETPEARTPRAAVEALATIRGHPYAVLAPFVADALAGHVGRLARAGLAHDGGIDAPLVDIPTAIGARRRAAILPAAQAAALRPWSGDEGLLLLDIARYRDAWAAYAARNLAAGSWPGGPTEIRAVTVDLPGLASLHNLNARTLALGFDDARWRAEALGRIAAALPAGAWRVGLPAVLGIADHSAALAEAERILGHRVFEMPSLPPSVPGIRLADALRASILAAGGRMQVGFDVVDVERAGSQVVAVHTEAASRTLRLAADTFVLATGGFGGEGFRARSDGAIHERVFGLPVEAPPRDAWFSDDPLVAHPIEAAGIRTDADLRPVDASGAVVLDNVRVIGSALAGMHYLEQRCGDGVALASAHAVASSLGVRRAAA